MSRILVTGASGFVGRAVVAAFAAGGHAVRAAASTAKQLFSSPSVEVARQPDLSQVADWEPLLDGVDRVVHLAGSERGADAATCDAANRQATAQLARAAARAGVRHLVYGSSIQAQCGSAADHTVTENDIAAPTDAFGRSKLAAEEAIRASGVPFTILRTVLLYGPGADGNFALVVRAAASSLPLPVKDFIGRRSLLSVDNFASALAFVLATPATIGETYLVADPGMALRIADVVATLRQAAGRRALIMPMSTDYIEMPLRLFGRHELWKRIGGNLRVDAGKLMAAGWQPLHDTRGGLTAMVQAAAPWKSGTASRSTR